MVNDIILSILGSLVGIATICNTLSIRSLMRRMSLLEGASTPRPRTLLEYLASRKGSAK